MRFVNARDGTAEEIEDEEEEESVEEEQETDLIETRIMAKMRYLPSSGTTRLVGGMISTTSKKNTCRLIRIEMDNVT